MSNPDEGVITIAGSGVAEPSWLKHRIKTISQLPISTAIIIDVLTPALWYTHRKQIR